MKANKKFSFRVFLFFSNAKILDYSHFDNDRAEGETFNTPIKRNDKQSNRRQTRGVARKKMAMGGTLARIVGEDRKRETKISANTGRKRSSQLTCARYRIRYTICIYISNFLSKLDLLFRLID